MVLKIMLVCLFSDSNDEMISLANQAPNISIYNIILNQMSNKYKEELTIKII